MFTFSSAYVFLLYCFVLDKSKQKHLTSLVFLLNINFHLSLNKKKNSFICVYQFCPLLTITTICCRIMPIHWPPTKDDPSRSSDGTAGSANSIILQCRRWLWFRPVRWFGSRIRSINYGYTRVGYTQCYSFRWKSFSLRYRQRSQRKGQNKFSGMALLIF